MVRRSVLLVALLMGGAMPARAQADSSRARVSLFTYQDAFLATGVVVAGLLAQPLDDHFATRLQDSSTQANRKLQRLSTFVRTTADPGSAIIGISMYAVGRLARNDRMAALGLHGSEALIIGEGVAVAIKGVFGRQRPHVQPRNSHSYQLFRGLSGDDKYRSFPSGHSVAAFAAAAAVTSETTNWWPSWRVPIGAAMYGGAALVGVSRMYDNRHWASDVIIGAGIGTFAGLKVVRFNHSNSGNRVDRFFLAGSLTPTSDGGHALRWTLLPGNYRLASAAHR